MLTRHRVYSALACCAVLLACSDGTAPADLDGCSGPVHVSVVHVSMPVFTWSGDCGISNLVVTTVAAAPADELPVWGFTVPERAPLASGVAYGRPPRRGTSWHSPENLVHGRSYRVSVMYTVGGDVQTGGGSTTFKW
jgi:hypothetical protein